MKRIRLSQISEELNLKMIGADIEIDGLSFCNKKTQFSSTLSFITSKDYIDPALSSGVIKALIVTPDLIKNMSNKFLTYIVDDYPEECFYTIHEHLYTNKDFYSKGDSPANIGLNCMIHDTAVVEKNVVIGENVVIGAHSIIRSNSVIGNNVRVGCNSVIGSNGFQALRDRNGIPYMVRHVGGTVLEDNVYIGDCVTICNTMLEGNVVIGMNTIIDNHVHIAHNCTLGFNNIVTAGVIMLGSSQLENNVWLSPGSLVMNKVIVKNNAMVAANSLAMSNVKENTVVMGSPAFQLDLFVQMQRAIKKLIKK